MVNVAIQVTHHKNLFKMVNGSMYLLVSKLL